MEDFIVALSVGGLHEEALIHLEMEGILSDAFQTFLVMELNAHPQAPDRRLLVKNLTSLYSLLPSKLFTKNKALSESRGTDRVSSESTEWSLRGPASGGAFSETRLSKLPAMECSS